MPKSRQKVVLGMSIKLHDDENVPSWARTTAYLIGSVGFPVAVSGWLLYRISPILEQQTRLLERVLWLLERGG